MCLRVNVTPPSRPPPRPPVPGTAQLRALFPNLRVSVVSRSLSQFLFVAASSVAAQPFPESSPPSGPSNCFGWRLLGWSALPHKRSEARVHVDANVSIAVV